MNARRRKPLRFLIGTMLIFVVWFSVVVWLTVRPRVDSSVDLGAFGDEYLIGFVEYGCPWSYAVVYFESEWSRPPERIDSFGKLAGNILTGLLAVTLLTWASTYLLRRITSWIPAIGRKSSPPDSRTLL